jgi:hypothetical protein
MGDFIIGLGITIMGFGFFQFSAMFNLYKAQKDEDTPPWPYWVLRSLAYISMGTGAIIMGYGILGS